MFHVEQFPVMSAQCSKCQSEVCAPKSRWCRKCKADYMRGWRDRQENLALVVVITPAKIMTQVVRLGQNDKRNNKGKNAK